MILYRDNSIRYPIIVIEKRKRKIGTRKPRSKVPCKRIDEIEGNEEK